MKINVYDKVKKVASPITIDDHKKLHYDELYVMRGVVEHTKFNGKLVTMVDELATNKGNLTITDENGDAPFAAFTNDSERDVFKNENVLARVVVKKGYHIAISFYGDNPKDPIAVYIFRVEEPRFDEGVYDSMLVRCIYRGNTLLPIENFEKLTEHIVRLSHQIDVPAQLKNKYCYQTTRKVMFCFMSKNDRDEVVSIRGKRMILNNNSRAKLNGGGSTIDEGVFRVYYSRRFENSPELYVEGVRVPDDCLNIDIEDYIRSTNIDVTGIIRILTTRRGRRIYAIVNNKGEIRPIIKLGKYTSFALSEREIADNIIDIEIYNH